jgi:glutathione S-transferase
MAIKVHGAWYSVATEMVFVTLFEKEVEFELIDVDILKGEHRQPEYLALQVS